MVMTSVEGTGVVAAAVAVGTFASVLASRVGDWPGVLPGVGSGLRHVTRTARIIRGASIECYRRSLSRSGSVHRIPAPRFHGGILCGNDGPLCL